MLIKKLDKQYDLQRILLEWNNIKNLEHWHNNNQMSIHHRGEISYTDGCNSLYYDFDGVKGTRTKKDIIRNSRDYKHINPIFKGTIFEEIIEEHKGWRGRLMIMKPKTVYTVHHDASERMHLPISTNDSSYFVFPENNHVEHIPANGYLYKVNTTETHTFFNADIKLDRIHMVFCV
jgi:hypothetical protein